MTLKKEIDFLHENFIFYLTGVLIILGLKCYYRQADCDSLLWILAPTACWVELLGKIPFTYISGAGYVNHSLRMVIAPSCSGVRFMTITFATLVFTFVHSIASSRNTLTFRFAQTTCGNFKNTKSINGKVRGFCWITVSAFLSWLFTVLVNGLRIIIAIYLPLCLEDAGLMRGILTSDRLHTMIGIAVYFIALLTIYRLAGWFVQRMVRPALLSQESGGSPDKSADAYTDVCGKHFMYTFMRKCVPPVFWYFTLTLGLPFLRRVCGELTAEFTEFAVIVIGCCALILLPYVILLLLRRKKRYQS